MDTTQSNVNGEPELRAILQRVNRASALLRTLKLAHNSDEQRDHDDYVEMLDAALHELVALDAIVNETRATLADLAEQGALDARRVQQ